MVAEPARPQRYYGWKLAWMLGPTQLVSWGILYYAFSVIMPPMRSEMGWSAAEASGAFSLAMLVNGLAAIPVGRWLDQRGPRLLMTVGSIAASLLVAGWSQVQSLEALYAVWACIGVAMAGVLYDPAFWVIARWFRRRRDRALTLVTFWGGLASTVFIPLTDALTRMGGWRAALLALAGLMAALTIVPHALLLRRRPEDVGDVMDGWAAESLPGAGRAPAPPPGRSLGEAVRERAFHLLALAFGSTSLMAAAMSVHLISYEVTRGISAALAASAAGAVGVLQVVGRLTFAPLAGRVSRRGVTALMCAFTALSIAALLILPPAEGLFVYVIFYGMGHGALTPLRASLIADLFGVGTYGRVNGALSLVLTVARAIAPVAVGALVTATGAYTPALVALGAGGLVAAVAVLFLQDSPAPGHPAGRP